MSFCPHKLISLSFLEVLFESVSWSSWISCLFVSIGLLEIIWACIWDLSEFLSCIWVAWVSYIISLLLRLFVLALLINRSYYLSLLIHICAYVSLSDIIWSLFTYLSIFEHSISEFSVPNSLYHNCLKISTCDKQFLQN